jgi:hypothetical protein
MDVVTTLSPALLFAQMDSPDLPPWCCFAPMLTLIMIVGAIGLRIMLRR